MNTRERILTIRLMEKLEEKPAYTKALGVEATGAARSQNTKIDPKGLTGA